jgi:hypothetical protein
MVSGLLVVVLGEVAGEHGTEDAKCGRHLLNGLGWRRAAQLQHRCEGVRVNRRRIASVEAILMWFICLTRAMRSNPSRRVSDVKPDERGPVRVT